MKMTDATHDPNLRSWVASANHADADFPIQNLPFARFTNANAQEARRIGVGIGDQILDLHMAYVQTPLASMTAGADELLRPLAEGDLAGFMAMGPAKWRAARQLFSRALAEGSDLEPFLELCLVPQDMARLELPCRIGDYSDFYAGIHHARAVGAMFRPDNALLPNYQWVPIGYHGRASSVVAEGAGVRRPMGQIKGEAAKPSYGPCQRLDYELELGFWIGGHNAMGERVGIERAEDFLFGVTPLNDWSARDIQAWEYQPLGPFLSKSFATTVSPWVVTMEALAPYRRPFHRPEGDPPPLPYLDSPFNQERGAFDIHLEVWLQTARMRSEGLAPLQLSRSNALDAYWTPAQFVTHHTSNGCNLNVGDLMGSGTLSGPSPGQGGSLLELTQGGRVPLQLPSGEQRRFLEDGDSITLRAWCEAPGLARIGLGTVTGTVLPAA